MTHRPATSFPPFLTKSPQAQPQLGRADIARWHQGVNKGTLKGVELPALLPEDLAHGLEALWRLPLPPLPVVHWRSERQGTPSRCMLLAHHAAAVLVWQARIAHDGLAPWQVELVVTGESMAPAQGSSCLLAQALDAMKVAFEQIPPNKRTKAIEHAGQAALLRGPCWSLLSGQATGTQLLGEGALSEPGAR